MPKIEKKGKLLDTGRVSILVDVQNLRGSCEVLIGVEAVLFQVLRDGNRQKKCKGGGQHLKHLVNTYEGKDKNYCCRYEFNCQNILRKEGSLKNMYLFNLIYLA